MVVTTLSTMARLVMSSWRLMSMSRSRRRTAALTLLGFLLLGQLQCSSSDPITRSLAQSESTRPSFNNTERFTTTCRLDDLVDATLLPDFWNNARFIDTRIKTNGDPPEQLVKVTDRRHRFPVFATVCSLAFLLTIIAIIVVCTH